MTSHQVRQFLVSKLGHLGDAVGPNRLDNLLVFHGQGSSCSGCIAQALWIETRQLLPGLFQQHCDGLPTSIAHFAKAPQSVGKVLGLLPQRHAPPAGPRHPTAGFGPSSGSTLRKPRRCWPHTVAETRRTPQWLLPPAAKSNGCRRVRLQRFIPCAPHPARRVAAPSWRWARRPLARKAAQNSC